MALPSGVTPVFLTVDDGAVSSYTHIADEFERYGWRGHFFITTDWINQAGFLNIRQIRELHDRGHVIASHTCSHTPRLSSLPEIEIRSEWTRSCDILSNIIGSRVDVASVPNGYHSLSVARAAASAGIKMLFTSEPTPDVSHVNGCAIFGRYFLRGSTPVSVSTYIGEEQAVYLISQAAVWKAKKVAKAVMGPGYASLRRFVVK
jgi:peptidoglycan/xylan/chitin deacetylase (PgdA/CDA1 family)